MIRIGEVDKKDSRRVDKEKGVRMEKESRRGQ